MTPEEENQVVQTLDADSGKCYVYALCNEDGTPFYIGKGSGRRIFNHRNEKQSTEASIESNTLLTDEQLIIVKWGLTEHEALMCESALINMLSFGNVKGKKIEKLANNVNGHASEAEKTSRAKVKTKARNVKQFLEECAIGKLPIENLSPYRFVVININRLYPKCLDATGKVDLHNVGECVRAFWWLGQINQTNRPDYILATYQMRVVGIFHVVEAMTIKAELQQGREPRFFPAFPEEERDEDLLKCTALSLDEAYQRLDKNRRKQLEDILRRELRESRNHHKSLDDCFNAFLKRAYFKVEEHGVNVPDDIMRFMNCIPAGRDGHALRQPFGGVVYRHWTTSHGFSVKTK